jgi:Relaxase/Mobilisation nuclease domain
MTANLIKGKGFRGALRYNLEKVEKSVAEVLDHSFASVSEKSILKEVEMIKVLRPNLQKFFYHTSINFPPSEELSNAMMTKIGQEYLLESGFTQHQYIMFRHYDADHPHLHILVNRIGYDGKVLSDSNDFARCEKVIRELEKRYKLTQVASSQQAKQRAATKDEWEMMKRTKTPSHKMKLQTIIKDVLNKNSKVTCSEFIQVLQNKGIQTQFNIATTGHVSGISYSYKGLIMTGSKLGADFKWTTLKNKIDYDQQRDQITILQANAQKNFVNETKSESSIPNISDIISHDTNDITMTRLTYVHALGNLILADHQSGVNPESALGLKQKKKKRRLRL